MKRLGPVEELHRHAQAACDRRADCTFPMYGVCSWADFAAARPTVVPAEDVRACGWRLERTPNVGNVCGEPGALPARLLRHHRASERVDIGELVVDLRGYTYPDAARARVNLDLDVVLEQQPIAQAHRIGRRHTD